jgi:8-oxo-dGTP pyrophosphatase MutT (NUDIX family)
VNGAGALANEPSFTRLRQALAARPAALAERDPPFKEAAVTLLLREAADDVELLLIRRATREGDPWSGQIGLPGGRWSPEDASLEQTALRETLEEVGLDVTRSGEVIGVLDELRPRTPVLPPIIVRPFVCALRDVPALTPSDEVAEMRWVRVGALFHPSTRVQTSVRVRDFQMKVAAYQVDDFTVWGMTERILATFEEVWR